MPPGFNNCPPKVRCTAEVALLLAVGGCGRDTAMFERAEAAYNEGDMPHAQQVYDSLIRQYPTSRWRAVAESQHDRTSKVLDLRTRVGFYVESEQFDSAMAAYMSIAAINPRLVDTATLLPDLRRRESERQAEVEAQHQRQLREAARMRARPYEDFGHAIVAYGDETIHGAIAVFETSASTLNRTDLDSGERIVRSVFGSIAAEVGQGADNLAALTPPTGLENAHKQVVDALRLVARPANEGLMLLVWASCELLPSGASCNSIERAAAVWGGSRMGSVFDRLAAAFLSYASARRRVGELLRQYGVALPDFELAPK
jgi:hypothetical protein